MEDSNECVENMHIASILCNCCNKWREPNKFSLHINDECFGLICDRCTRSTHASKHFV